VNQQRVGNYQQTNNNPMTHITLCKEHYKNLWNQIFTADERECKFCQRANESKEEYEVRQGTRLWVGSSRRNAGTFKTLRNSNHR
jgi:hypothetical protein